jgi:hypothetical protein
MSEKDYARHASERTKEKLANQAKQNGQGGGPGRAEVSDLPWEAPVPLTPDSTVPEFPADTLPDWMRGWAEAEARATQTPVDLPGLLALAIAGAGMARKFRVQIRSGWTEPVNLFTVAVLNVGERKSTVYRDVTQPVREHEEAEIERMVKPIAEAAGERRLLEARLKAVETKAAKTDKPDEAQRLRNEARQLARELTGRPVPDSPQLICDDITPEELARLLARQGGRMLQASPEGTAFEIAKGRYSETANFDVYLKGHAGDPLCVNRVSREVNFVDSPALSLALAVQPDVISGLAERAAMRGRGFLARFLYSVPLSLVGRRQIAPAAMPKDVETNYRSCMRALWRLSGDDDEQGRPAPNWLSFSAAADQAIQQFEKWLEPQLAPGELLSNLAGWANKLAGAVARIAGILHVAEAVGSGENWQTQISAETVEAAIRLGRDYLLPHAQAAFGLMGTDPRLEDARRAVAWLRRPGSVKTVKTEKGALIVMVTRRDLHAGVWGGSRKSEEVDAVIDLLKQYLYLRVAPEPRQRSGPGRNPSPRYLVNPAVLAQGRTEALRSRFSQNSQNSPATEGVDDSVIL